MGIIAGTNYIIDPLQQFRVASLYTLEYKNERYLNAGLAKSYPYGSVVIGTSMVENFYIDDLKKIIGFVDPIKLSVRGGNGYEEAITLETAFKNQSIQQVLIGLDSFSFNGSAAKIDSGNTLFPLYLYEDSLLGTMKYLTNFKFFEQSIKSLKNPYDAKKSGENYNYMYAWQSDYSHCFTEAYVRNDWNSLFQKAKSLSAEESLSYKSNFDRKILVENFKKTFLPIIINHPETEFYLFFPPYSALAYKLMEYQGVLDEHLAFKEAVFELTKSHHNVYLFDFNLAEQITDDLANYKDYTHYHDGINQWMLEQMKLKKFLILKSSDLQIDRFKEKIGKLDVEQLFIDSYRLP
jgi:hypothetical protein